MKIKHLLAAVSAVALSAGTANALDLANTGTDFQNPLATQLDLVAAPIGGDAIGSLTLTGGGDFPPSEQITVTVTLPVGVTFATQAVSGDLTTSTAASVANYISGGTDTDNVVEYQVGLATSGQVSSVNFNFDVAVGSCDNLADGITIVATDSTGSGILGEGTTVTDTSFFAGGCANALVGAVDSDTSTSDTTISLISAFTSLNEAGTAVANGTATAIGTVQYEIQDGSPATEANVVVDAGTTNLAATDISSVTFTVVTGDTSNSIAISSSAAAPAVQDTTDPTRWNLTLTGAEATAGVTIEATATDVSGSPVLLNTQAIEVVDAQVNYGLGFISPEPGANGALDTLQREGQSFGVFDWNGGEKGRTLSVFRVTGLDANSTTDFNVVISNSTGTDVNGLYEGTITANENGVASLSSAGYGNAAVPDNKNHDSLVTFLTPKDLDMDRLITRNGIVASFGDGANSGFNSAESTPSNDGDQNNVVSGFQNE